jgi:DNA-binding NarL/FixJ family response regulator
MRILLADDQMQIRSALRLLLEQGVGLSVVGEAAGAESLLALAKETKPDLLLTDWDLVKKRDVGIIRFLREEYPSLRVIALSGRPEVRQEALQAGADAFVSKGEPPQRLMDTIYTTLSG